MFTLHSTLKAKKGQRVSPYAAYYAHSNANSADLRTIPLLH